ncbi:Nuclear pore complex protein NUP58 [Zea mays]|uniref:Nuclear pore complex protein NUP58 n=1 Tax=Zea mays TaxID=4577 RepID=A0A1D6L616_MAIZE|nr:Nuclear pore complex protein NUP58 [Zea mays]
MVEWLRCPHGPSMVCTHTQGGRIREHRDDSEQLDQCRRFDDLSLCNISFELKASQITQEAVSISTIMNREKNSIECLMTVIREIMRNTEFAIRSYVQLRARFVYPSAESANSGFSNHSGSSGAQTDFHQLLATTPRFRCYSSAARRPSPFVQQTVARFEDDFGYCCKLILELEQLLQMKDGKTFAESLKSLSNVVSNVHDYLIHVASKVEHFHQYVETVKTQYLNDRRRRGDLSNPFLEANNREAVKQATDRIIHPMLHLAPPCQPTTLVVAPMIGSQLQQTSFHTVATFPSSCPTVPLPSVLPPSSIQTSPAPSTNPFNSSGPVLQSMPFDPFSTLALGSMPAASLFGTRIPSSATSLVPVPSGGGTAASGVKFNRVPSMFGGHACPLQRTAYLSHSSARGRSPRETICDLYCGWRGCEEASAHKSATSQPPGAGLCFEV